MGSENGNTISGRKKNNVTEDDDFFERMLLNIKAP